MPHVLVNVYLNAQPTLSVVRTTTFSTNANKTKVLLVGSRHNLIKLADEDFSLITGLETVQPSNVVHDLGVWQHVTKSVLPTAATTSSSTPTCRL